MTPAEIAERVAELRVVVADHQRLGWGIFTTTTEKAAALLAACEENARLRARLGDDEPVDWDAAPTIDDWIASTFEATARRKDLKTEWRRDVVLGDDDMIADCDELRRVATWLRDLRSQRDALLASAEALFANKDYTEVRLAYETSFAGTDELADLQEIVRRISAAKEAT